MKRNRVLFLIFCLILSLVSTGFASQSSEAALDTGDEVVVLQSGYSIDDENKEIVIPYANEMVGIAATGAVSANSIIDYNTGLVTISGKLPSEQVDKVTVLVLRPPHTIQDAVQMDEIELVGAVEYINVINSNEDGSFSFKYALNFDNLVENQGYSVRIGSDNGQGGTSSYKYFGQSDVVAVITAIKGANATTIGNMLASTQLIDGDIYLNDVLQLDLTDYLSLRKKDGVHSALAGKDFTSGGINAIRKAFHDAVDEQKEFEDDDQALNDAINAFKNATAATMAAVIEEHGEILGLDLSAEYGYKMLLDRKANGLNTLHNALVGKSTASAIETTFNQQVAIQAVNIATWQEMSNVITSNTALGLNLSGDFAGLNSDKKASVYKALAKVGNFTTIRGIQDAFNDAVKAAKNTNNGGGSSNGGGSGSGSYRPPIVITEPAPTRPTVPETVEFKDIGDVSWAKESIEALAERGVINGISNDTFAPNDNVTREQFVKMLVVAFGLVDQGATSDFQDVNKDEWYYQYISSAHKYGIVNGIDSDNFGVGRDISRHEMAALAHRTATYAGVILAEISEPANFDDAQEIAQYATESITAMQQASIIQGVGDNRFAPHDTATRAMAAKVIYELLQLR